MKNKKYIEFVIGSKTGEFGIKLSDWIYIEWYETEQLRNARALELEERGYELK